MACASNLPFNLLSVFQSGELNGFFLRPRMKIIFLYTADTEYWNDATLFITHLFKKRFMIRQKATTIVCSAKSSTQHSTDSNVHVQQIGSVETPPAPRLPNIQVWMITEIVSQTSPRVAMVLFLNKVLVIVTQQLSHKYLQSCAFTQQIGINIKHYGGRKNKTEREKKKNE